MTNMIISLLIGGAIARTKAARSEGGPQSTRVDRHDAAAMSRARWGDREGHTANFVKNAANRAARGRVGVAWDMQACCY